MTKERVGYIDVAKGVGIILVILGHSMYGDVFLKNVIYSFHMPFFFMLSGYFLNFERSIKSNIKKSFRMLVIPYLLVSFIQILLYAIFEQSSIIPELQTAVIGGGNLFAVEIDYQPVIWFIPVLFLARLFNCVFFSQQINLSNDLKYALVVAFAFCSIIITNHLGIVLPFFVSQTFVASLFLLCGQFIRRNNILANYSIVVTPCLLFCCLAYSSRYLWMIMQTNTYPYAFIHAMSAVVMSVSLLFIIKYVCTMNYSNIVYKGFVYVLQWCGRYSLLILLIHFFDDKNILLFIDKSTITENSAFIFLVRIAITLPVAYLLLKVRSIRRFLKYE